MDTLDQNNSDAEAVEETTPTPTELIQKKPFVLNQGHL